MTDSCPLCSHSDFLPVLHRPKTMVSSNVLYATAAGARNAPVGELSIVLCRHCGFAFNRAFDLALVPYGSAYDNDQSQSGRFFAHMQEMAGRVRAATQGKPLRLIEVGCGQGQFLRLLLGNPPAPEDGAVGFDPSYNGDAIPGCQIHREFFGPESACSLKFQPNVVISRHVIEHVPAPPEMLCSIRSALGQTPEVTVCFETPSLAWIFENNAFWDLCYEHCSYFTDSSLRFAFESCGFRSLTVETVFGGQYLWIEAVPGAPHGGRPEVLECAAERFSQAIRENRDQWRARLEQSGRGSKIAVWGAATKGATFVQDVDPEGTLVSCLIDINPRKQCRYIPITAHLIMDWQSAIADGVTTIVTMNPNYLSEIKELVGRHAPHINVLCL